MNSQFKVLPFSVAATALVGSVFLVCAALLNNTAINPFTQFSLVSVLLPLSGLWGVAGVGVMTIGRILLTLLMSGGPLSGLVYYIPTLCASTYWAFSSRLYPVVVFLACIALFIAHPVGSLAAPYALYWLIPVLFAFLPRTIIFARALTSTFLAHAVGSVIFLYWGPISTPADWMALIPVVAFERFIFALGMTASYYYVVSARTVLTSFFNRVYLRAVQ